MARTLNLGTLNVRLAVSGFNRFDRNLGKATRSLNRFGAASQALRSVTNAMGGMIAVAGKFEASMTRVRAVAGANVKEYNQMREAALRLSSATMFTAREVSKGMEFMAMAGNDAVTTMKAMPAVLDLAAASGVNLGRSADIVTNIMAGFGKTTKELAGVNDVLVATFTNSNVTLNELGRAFADVGPTAKALQIEISDVAAAVGTLGNAGIKGSKAGRQLARMLISVAAPSRRGKKALAELNITADDLSGGFVHLVRKLEDARSKMSSSAFVAAANNAFGAFGGRSATALVEQGSKNIDRLTTKLKGARGVAKSIAEMQMDTLAGEIKELESKIEALSITLGQTFVPGLKTTVEWLNKMFQAMPKWMAENAKGPLAVRGEVDVGTVSHTEKAYLENLRKTRKELMALGPRRAFSTGTTVELPTEFNAQGDVTNSRFIPHSMQSIQREIDRLTEKYEQSASGAKSAGKSIKDLADELRGGGGRGLPSASATASAALDSLSQSIRVIPDTIAKATAALEKAKRPAPGDREAARLARGVTQVDLDEWKLVVGRMMAGGFAAPGAAPGISGPDFSGGGGGGRVATRGQALGMAASGAMGDFLRAVEVSTEDLFGKATSAVTDGLRFTFDAILSQVTRVFSGLGDTVARTIGSTLGDVLSSSSGGQALMGALSRGGGAGGGLLGAAGGVGALGGMAASGAFGMANAFGGPALGAALAAPIAGLTALAAALPALVGSVTAAGVGLFQLSLQTESFAKFGKVLDAAFQNIVGALEPLWRSMLPVAALFYRVTEALAIIIGPLADIAPLASALFDVFKFIATNGLNAAIALGKAHNGIVLFTEGALRAGAQLAQMAGDSGLSQMLAQMANSLPGLLDLEGLSAALVEVNAMTRSSGFELASSLLESGERIDEAGRQAGESLRNLPSGFKVALAQFGATDPVGGGGFGMTDSGRRGAGSVVNINGPITVAADDPMQFVSLVNEMQRSSAFLETGNAQQIVTPYSSGSNAN